MLSLPSFGGYYSLWLSVLFNDSEGFLALLLLLSANTERVTGPPGATVEEKSVCFWGRDLFPVCGIDHTKGRYGYPVSKSSLEG